jgi:hypothetical protein
VVYYDMNNPSQCCLEPGFSYFYTIVIGSISLLCLLGGFITFRRGFTPPSRGET